MDLRASNQLEPLGVQTSMRKSRKERNEFSIVDDIVIRVRKTTQIQI